MRNNLTVITRFFLTVDGVGKCLGREFHVHVYVFSRHFELAVHNLYRPVCRINEDLCVVVCRVVFGGVHGNGYGITAGGLTVGYVNGDVVANRNGVVQISIVLCVDGVNTVHGKLGQLGKIIILPFTQLTLLYGNGRLDNNGFIVFNGYTGEGLFYIAVNALKLYGVLNGRPRSN